MADKRLAIGLGALVTITLGVAALTRGDAGQRLADPTPVALPRSIAASPLIAPLATPAAPLGRSGLAHDKPPPLENLRNQSHAQAIYDAEAMPGDFVTPPAVSVEH